MSGESVCKVARSWVDMGSFCKHLFGVVYVTCAIFMMDQRKEQQVCSSAMTQFLAKHKMAVIPHTPYSPDLAPCIFFLFPKMKLKLKGCQFDTTEEIQAE
jgi:hypothetical protein